MKELKDIQYRNKDGVMVNLVETVGEDCCWETKSGTKVLKHAKVQELAAKEEIRLVDIRALVSPTSDNMMQHGIAITIENSKGQKRCKTGEASRLNTGRWTTTKTGAKKEHKYLEKEEVDCKYRLAMAEKRAFDRAVLEELQLFDVKSDIEAQAFEQPKEESSSDVPKDFNY